MKNKLLIIALLIVNFCFGQKITFDELLFTSKMSISEVELFILNKGYDFILAEDSPFDVENQLIYMEGGDYKNPQQQRHHSVLNENFCKVSLPKITKAHTVQK